jgi:hypothetical protein
MWYRVHVHVQQVMLVCGHAWHKAEAHACTLKEELLSIFGLGDDVRVSAVLACLGMCRTSGAAASALCLMATLVRTLLLSVYALLQLSF